MVGGALDPCDLFGFGDADGRGNAARLQHPLGIACINSKDAAGLASLATADSYNHKLKIVTDLDKKKAKVTTTGLVTLPNFVLFALFASCNQG